MRTPGWWLAQVKVRSSTSSLTCHSPGLRPFCLTWARLPTRRSPSSRRRTSSYVVIRSRPALDVAQHLPDLRGPGRDGEGLLVLHDSLPLVWSCTKRYITAIGWATRDVRPSRTHLRPRNNRQRSDRGVAGEHEAEPRRHDRRLERAPPGGGGRRVAGVRRGGDGGRVGRGSAQHDPGPVRDGRLLPSDPDPRRGEPEDAGRGAGPGDRRRSRHVAGDPGDGDRPAPAAPGDPGRDRRARPLREPPGLGRRPVGAGAGLDVRRPDDRRRPGAADPRRRRSDPRRASVGHDRRVRGRLGQPVVQRHDRQGLPACRVDRRTAGARHPAGRLRRAAGRDPSGRARAHVVPRRQRVARPGQPPARAGQLHQLGDAADRARGRRRLLHVLPSSRT